MRKAILAILLTLILVATAHSYMKGLVKTVFDAEAVASTATVTSSGIDIGNKGVYFGVWYKAISASGTPDIKIEYEVSYNDIDANYVEPEGASDIVTNLTDETQHAEYIDPPPMKFLRFKITGNVGNPSDTVIYLQFFFQVDSEHPGREKETWY